MKITTYGRGNIGGGLGARWERAGHDVTELGRDGGDVSGADVVLLAVPGEALSEALDKLTGLEGKTVIDATNLIGAEPPDGFASNAEYVKSRTGGPTAKSFNINFARLLDQLDRVSTRPGDLWCGDDEAREVTEQLNRDVGYDPIYAGGLENASALEAFVTVPFAIAQGGMGPFFYRMAPPDQF
jgi:8-hydroxy-5-deazaflavin:NADPH oxidoreductase